MVLDVIAVTGRNEDGAVILMSMTRADAAAAKRRSVRVFMFVNGLISRIVVIEMECGRFGERCYLLYLYGYLEEYFC